MSDHSVQKKENFNQENYYRGIILAVAYTAENLRLKALI